MTPLISQTSQALAEIVTLKQLTQPHINAQMPYINHNLVIIPVT